MTDLRLSARDVEDVLAGRQPDGRADLAAVAEFAATLHASSEVEPPPPMSAALRTQIVRGVTPEAPAPTRRHRPRHLRAVPEPRTGLAAYRRPLLSMAAAAVLLVGLVVLTSRGELPDEVHSAVSDVGSAIGFDLFREDDAAPADEDPPATSTTTTSTSTTTTTTAPPPPTTAAPPTTAVPAPTPGGGEDLPWWLSPEVWQHWFGRWSPDGHEGGDRDDHDGYDRRDGDRDGEDRSGWRGTGDGRTGSTAPAGGYSHGSTAEATVMPDTSTTVSPTSTGTSSTSTTASSTTTVQ